MDGPTASTLLHGDKTRRGFWEMDGFHSAFLLFSSGTQASSGWDPRATCQDFVASGLALILFPDIGQIPFPEYQIKVSPLWEKNKKRFHGLNSHSPLCLWHCSVSFPACSLGGSRCPFPADISLPTVESCTPSTEPPFSLPGLGSGSKRASKFPQTLTDLPPPVLVLNNSQGERGGVGTGRQGKCQG